MAASRKHLTSNSKKISTGSKNKGKEEKRGGIGRVKRRDQIGKKRPLNVRKGENQCRRRSL